MSTYALDGTSVLSMSCWMRKFLICGIMLGLWLAGHPKKLTAFQDTQQSQPPAQSGRAPQYTEQTPEQLQQLVAPIALYADSLVAQVLAASTFPAEIVEADRWVQDHSDLKGDALAQAVNQQNWDPSVKALTAFPSVLANMDKNLSWTSSLGDAYYNQQQAVMDAVQIMRQKAQQSGNLKSTPQQTVEKQGTTIIIQPSNPEIVYVPAYDPWVIYGYPVAPWPYWYPTPGIWYNGPFLSFGIGFSIGFYSGYEWGWNGWNTNWHSRIIVYNHNTYYSRSNTFYNRKVYYRGGGERGVASSLNRKLSEQHGRGYDNRNALGVTREADGNRGIDRSRTDSIPDRSRGPEPGDAVYNRPGATPRPFNNDYRAARGFGYSQPDSGFGYSRPSNGMRSSAFSGFNFGGEARSFSSRGFESFGGGGFGGGGRRRR
jgi:uncharacterized membrane protein YgcG